MSGTDAIATAPAKSYNKGVWGWMLFDWAAQPFFTVVTTFIFGPYFISRMVLDANGNPDPVAGQAAWGYAIAIGGIIMAVLAPVLGSIADQTGPRKPWIMGFGLIQIAGCVALWWGAPGASVFWILAAYTMAAIAAEFSSVFNDSMLPRIVSNAKIGEVSNTAWGLGYLGGMIVLIVVLLLLAGSMTSGLTLIGIAPLFGLDPAHGEDARVTGPLAAMWYLVFILPMFFFTPDPGVRRALGPAVRDGLSELGETLKELRRRAGLVRFLIARMIYQDGVGAILALGGGFAAGMFGWTIIELGIYGIILNVVAIGGSIAGGRLDTAKGSKWVVLWSVIFLLAATIGIVSTGARGTAQIAFDPAKLSAQGLEGAAVIEMLRTGDRPLTTGVTQQTDGTYEIGLKTAVDAIENFRVKTASGEVKLSDIATIDQGGYTLFGALQFAPSSVSGMFSTGAEKAYIVFGLLIGLVFGPVQASSRAYMARSVAEHETGRYFGIYALSGRATSFLAPLMVAVVTDWTESARIGMSMIMIFFAIGLAILLTTPYPAHDPSKSK